MYLLDTNALIILMFGNVANAKLSNETLGLMEKEDKLYISEISLWEIAIKVKLQKLDITQPVTWIAEQCRANGIDTIPVSVEQFAETMKLPLLKDHGDPFDRLIICVAKMKGLKLITTDGKILGHKEEYCLEALS
ncbi:MAG: type II toxin-antitoxin system VapC family toxin [Lachnospiraceae bacterium]|nr:type II toxin-antitoxin system VapC family toxin [Lachnospiraceae bacterium]